MLTDIHCHILYGVDDGPGEADLTEKLLVEANKEGVTTIIATPHFRYDMFEPDKGKVDETFAKVKEMAASYGISLYPGCEYHVNSHMVEDIRGKSVHTLCDGDYVLCEYSHDTDERELIRYTQSLLSIGYLSVIAHVERYDVIGKKPKLLSELREMDALIQVNAESVLGRGPKVYNALAKNIMKLGLCDIIAGDAHGVNRPAMMKECYDFVSKKYSAGFAEKLFISNPNKIVNSINEVD